MAPVRELQLLVVCFLQGGVYYLGQLCRCVKRGAQLCDDICAVLNERIELELAVAKRLHTLSLRLGKVVLCSLGCLPLPHPHLPHSYSLLPFPSPPYFHLTSSFRFSSLLLFFTLKLLISNFLAISKNLSFRHFSLLLHNPLTHCKIAFFPLHFNGSVFYKDYLDR